MKIRRLKSGNYNAVVYDYTDGNGVKHQQSFTAPTKDEVEWQVLRFLQEKKLRGKQHRNGLDERTVQEIVKLYIDKRERGDGIVDPLSPSTISGYRKAAAEAFPDLMAMKARNLTDEICQDEIIKECGRETARKEGTVTPKTVRNEWGLIAAALKSVCNLTFNVTLPKVKTAVKILPPSSAIIEAVVDTEIELPVMLSLWCSLRQGEVMALDETSMQGGYLVIDKTLVMGQIKPGAKTDGSIRAIKIPPYIQTLIDKRLEEARAAGETSPIRLVSMDKDALYKRFVKAMKGKGYEMSFHDLRHAFASDSLSVLKLPEKEVQTTGGWKTPHVMKGVYSNASEPVMSEADKARNEYYDALILKAKAKKEE